jgi:hypothetical protein
MADAMDMVVEAPFVFVTNDGTTTDVTIVIGRPCRTSAGDWACSAQFHGLPPCPSMVGEDSLQALSLALSLVRRQCEAFLRQGGRILLPGTDEDVPMAAYFPASETD